VIDLHTSSVVALRDLPDLLPRRRGRKVHLSTIYRWADRGVGGIRLETTRIGGVLYTSHEALAEFTRLLSKDTAGDGLRGSRERLKQRDEAKRRLDDAGVK